MHKKLKAHNKEIVNCKQCGENKGVTGFLLNKNLKIIYSMTRREETVHHKSVSRLRSREATKRPSVTLFISLFLKFKAGKLYAVEPLDSTSKSSDLPFPDTFLT